jgi:hypothetical protein
MSVDSVIVMGTLKSDGTLELDERPALAPGRVQVAILAKGSPAASQRPRSVLDVLDDIHAAQAARGYRGRSVSEMEAHEAERRAEEDQYEERWRTVGDQPTPAPPRGTGG